MNCNSYADFFQNFANKTRFGIIMVLKKPLSVTEISEELKEEQSAISHNLKKLLDCRIITVKQKGKQRIYSLNKETVVPILKLIEKHTHKNCELCRKNE